MQSSNKSTAKPAATGLEAAALTALANDVAACAEELGQLRRRFVAHQKALATAAKTAPVVATLRDWKGKTDDYTVAAWAADCAREIAESLKEAIVALQQTPADLTAEVRRHVADQQAEQDKWRERAEWRRRVARAMLLANELSTKDGNTPDPLLTRSPWPFHRRALKELAKSDPAFRSDLKEFDRLEKRIDDARARWDGKGVPPHMSAYHAFYGRYDYLDSDPKSLRAALVVWADGL
jgi:hypothetical protein